MMRPETHQVPKPEFEAYTIKCGTAMLSPHPEIELRVGTPHAHSIRIQLSHQLIMGRMTEQSSTIDINFSPFDALQKGVSRRHARLEVVNKILMITDLNSANGTFINGQIIPPGQRRVVRDGDELMLGNFLVDVFLRPTDPLR